MSQTRVQENAAVLVQAKALQNMKETGAALARLMDSANINAANTITDPARGKYLNMLM